MTDSELTRLLGLGTSTVSDAMDRLGVEGAALGLRPLDRRFRLVGRAFTVRYSPVGVEHGNVGDYIDDVPPGQVVVLDNAGRLDCTVWGDILTKVAHRRGVAGTVIHGVCRDTDISLQLSYPIFSRGSYMRTGKDRVQVDAYNEPVSLGTVRVNPGDVLVGDGDGIVVVPRALEDQVWAAAQDIFDREQAIRNAAQSGARLDEVRSQFGYFNLQSRRTTGHEE